MELRRDRVGGVQFVQESTVGQSDRRRGAAERRAFLLRRRIAGELHYFGLIDGWIASLS